MMIDPNAVQREKEKNARITYLYCLGDSKQDAANENEVIKVVNRKSFWRATKECENIEEISIPADLEIDVDTLAERLPKLWSVIIRFSEPGSSEYTYERVDGIRFKNFFSKSLIIGQDGITAFDYPDHKLRPKYKVGLYRPDLYPDMEERAICHNVYEENLDYKNTNIQTGGDLIYGKSDWGIPQPRYGVRCLGIEIIRLAKDVLK